MTNYCVTGPRKLSYPEACIVQATLAKKNAETWHIGDAGGADKVARDYLESQGDNVTLYRAEGRMPWQGENRRFVQPGAM